MRARNSLVRLLAFLKPCSGLISLAIAITLLASVSALAVPWVGRLAIDRVTRTGALSDLNYIFLALAVLWLITAALQFARDLLANRIGYQVVTDMRARVISHALNLPVGYFDAAQVGDVTTRVMSDTEQLRRTITEDFIRGFGDCAILIGSAVLLLTLDWKLTTALLALGVIAPVAHRWLSPRLRSLNRTTLDATSAAISRLAEAITNVRLVKSFGREAHEASIMSNALGAVFRAALRASRFESAVWTSVSAGFGLIALGVVWYGVHGIVNGSVSLGAMLAYFYTLTLVAAPLTSVAGAAARAQRAQAAADRMYEILDLPPESAEPAGLATLRVQRGDISFVDVRFAYEAGKSVLNGVTLDVPAGSTLALFGATGAGKTTLFSLLQRFYEVESGDIRIDGISISNVTRSSVRSALAVVPQEALLFEGTIADNIRYGRTDASDSDVRNAAAAAHVDEFALRLNAGLETRIGERGMRLSGGQRQRIAIARALLRNAPILLLDEATSSLDAHSESLVQDAMRTLMRGRTTLVIAHRVRTVEQADRIAVLEAGRIAAVGTHDELSESCALYRHLLKAPQPA